MRSISESNFVQSSYCALFCLEYRVKPHDIKMELRIYQNDEVRFEYADPDVIAFIMDQLVRYDARIDKIREENEL